MRDYQIVSPSLDGILHHESIVYEGLKRPFELLRIMDGPISRGNKKLSEKGGGKKVIYTDVEYKVIKEYTQDLYSLFMKKLSQFMVDPNRKDDEDVKLQAMLQEMIKIKKLL